MATTKTAKKTTSTTKRVVSKTPTKTTKSTQIKMKSTNTPTVSDFQKKVTDPKNRKSLILAIIVIVLIVVIYFGKGLVVAALVNGQPVSRLSIIHDLEQQSGKAALDAVETRMLVFQEADKKHITVTDKEVDAEIARIKTQFQSQGQNLDQLLATQGLTQDKFRDEVKVQLLVTKILGDQVKVTDKEFNDFLAKNKDLLTNEKDQNAAKVALRQQMVQQKLAQKYQEWIVTVKKNAKIQTFVSY